MPLRGDIEIVTCKICFVIFWIRYTSPITSAQDIIEQDLPLYVAKNTPIEDILRHSKDFTLRRAFEKQCLERGGLVQGSRVGQLPRWVLQEVAAGNGVSHFAR